jgi:hypothetical protein
MKISRVVLLLLVLPLAAACGSNVVPSSGEAHTMACRSYVLTVGDTDKEHAKKLVDDAPYSSAGIDADAILDKVRNAAASSGATAGLSDDDFSRFRQLVEVIDALPGKVKTLDDNSQLLASADLAALTKAVAQVHKLCY